MWLHQESFLLRRKEDEEDGSDGEGILVMIMEVC